MRSSLFPPGTAELRGGGPTGDEFSVSGCLGVLWKLLTARRPPSLVYHPYGVDDRLLLEVCGRRAPSRLVVADAREDHQYFRGAERQDPVVRAVHTARSGLSAP